MIDFELSKEHKMLQKEVQVFIKEEVKPLAEAF